MKERDVQREVCKVLRQLGYHVIRIQSGKVKVRGGWMELAPEGTPDVLALKPPETLWVEVKTPAGEMRPMQTEFIKLATGCRHGYLVARSADDVIAAMK